MTNMVRASALVDVCPVCLTTGASQHRRCVYCGAWFVCRHCQLRFTTDQVTTARFCPDCGQPVERPDVTTSDSSSLPPVAAEPVAAPASSDLRGVADVLSAHLTKEPADDPAEAAVRAAQVELADVLSRHGRHVEALAVLDDALNEPGPPREAAVQLRRALARLQTGDEVGGARAALEVAAAAPDDYVDVLVAFTTELSALTARSLESHLTKAWGDKSKTIRQAEPTTRCAIHGMRAGAALARGQLDLAISELEAAAADDQDLAEDLWPRLAARPEASATRIDGGTAGALTFRARGFAAVGDGSKAVELARAVLAEALTAENKPEAECHLILAEAATDADDRGYHLMEAGRLMATRTGPGDLERALDVLERAAQADPTRAETYWFWSDNQRVAAHADGTPDPALLRRSLEIWERGRELGPCDGAWPHLVEAAICAALADVGGDDEVRWAFRALRASDDAVRLDDGSWAAPWVALAKAARRLQLWRTSWYADERCAALMGDPDEGNLSELEELVVASYHMAPERLAPWLDVYESLSAPDWWSRTLRAASETRDERWVQARKLLRDIPADTQDGNSTMRAYLLTVAGDRSAEKRVSALREEATDENAARPSHGLWLDLLAGDAASCLAGLAAYSPTVDLDDPCDGLSLRLHSKLLLGEHDEARTCFSELATVLRPGTARDLQVELRWVAKMCREQGDKDSAALADELREAAWSTGAHEGAVEDVEQALAELDNRLAQHPDDAPGNPELSATRALLSLYAGPRAIDPDDWPVLLVVELGTALVPADAEENWEDWPLFTTLIPEAREELRSHLGFPVMGISIQGSNQLEPHEYRPVVNGRPGSIRVVADASVFPPGKRIDEYPSDGAPWHECLDALQATVLANPTEVLVPHTIETLLGEWREDDDVPDLIVEAIDPNRLLRLRVWQRLRAELAEKGRLPGWRHGLEDLVAEAMSDSVRASEPSQVSS